MRVLGGGAPEAAKLAPMGGGRRGAREAQRSKRPTKALRFPGLLHVLPSSAPRNAWARVTAGTASAVGVSGGREPASRPRGGAGGCRDGAGRAPPLRAVAASAP